MSDTPSEDRPKVHPQAVADAHGPRTAASSPASPDAPPSAVPRPAQGTRVPRGRASKAWVGSIIGALVLVFLLIFILQNGNSVRLDYLGAQFSLPAGVSMLLALLLGVAIMAVIGSARIHQLRRAFKRRKMR